MNSTCNWNPDGGRPARTGICRHPHAARLTFHRPPRADGGLPTSIPPNLSRYRAAPRRRGSARIRVKGKLAMIGRPARTGVSPCGEVMAIRNPWTPRADGGQPNIARGSRHRAEAAPHGPGVCPGGTPTRRGQPRTPRTDGGLPRQRFLDRADEPDAPQGGGSAACSGKFPPVPTAAPQRRGSAVPAPQVGSDKADRPARTGVRHSTPETPRRRTAPQKTRREKSPRECKARAQATEWREGKNPDQTRKTTGTEVKGWRRTGQR